MRTDRKDDALPTRDSSLRATLLPTGPGTPVIPEDAGPGGTGRGPRRFRWDIVLGCVLALVAVVVTLIAVGGLRGPAPAPRTAAAQPPRDQVVVEPRGTTGLHVTERLSLPRLVRTVQLTRPDPSSGSDLGLPQPVISGLTAAGTDVRLQVRATPAGWTVTGDRDVRDVVVTYDVAGTVLLEPDAPVRGRALLVVTPVTAAAARGAGVPVEVTAPGTTVRQATCVTSPSTQQLCGTASASGWTARLTNWQDVAVVVLQVDLRN